MQKCLLIIAFLVSFAPVISFAAEKAHGVFMIVKGTVQIQSPGKFIEKAKVGLKVLEGDKIVTGADSRAKIVMSDRNVLNLSPDTSIQIEVYKNDPSKGTKNVEIKLSEGKLRSNVEQVYDGQKDKFQVKTPTAVAGVRGTQFQTSFNSKTSKTSVVAFKGSVAVLAVNPQGRPMGAPVVIKRGEMTTTSSEVENPSAPTVVPAEEMKEIERETSVSQTPAADSVNSDGTSREVASTPNDAPVAVENKSTPSMIDAKDLDLGIAKDIKAVKAPPTASITPPMVRSPQTDTTLRDLIRSNGKTKTVIRPQPK